MVVEDQVEDPYQLDEREGERGREGKGVMESLKEGAKQRERRGEGKGEKDKRER